MNVSTHIDFDVDIDDIWTELESYVESKMESWNADSFDFTDNSEFNSLEDRVTHLESAMSDLGDRIASDEFDLSANPQFDTLHRRVSALERGEGPLRNAVHAVTSGPDAMRSLNNHIDARLAAITGTPEFAEIVVKSIVSKLFTK